MKRTGWDRLVLPNGWIAIWAGMALIWLTGWAVTGNAFWASDAFDAFMDWLPRLGWIW